jgi:hypothetical protein
MNVSRFSMRFVIIAVLLVSFGASHAASITLFENAVYVNVNGDVSQSSGASPGAFNSSLFDFHQGLGRFSVEVTVPGQNYVSLFVDHEVDEPINTFFNELGSTMGTPAAGQTWEIDEPGYMGGDIFDNFEAGALDNTVGFVFPGGDDVSMALAWAFALNAGERAKIDFILSDAPPTSGPAIGFQLAQNDPDSAVTIYFSSSIEIISPGTPVPDAGATAPLLALGLCSVAMLLRRESTPKN